MVRQIKKPIKPKASKKSNFVESGQLGNLLKAAALVAEAGSRGSAGNIASTIVESELDLSNFRKRNGINKKQKEKGPNNGKGPSAPNEENVWMPEKQWGDFPDKRNTYT